MYDHDERVPEIDTRLKPTITRSSYTKEDLEAFEERRSHIVAARGKRVVAALGGLLVLAFAGIAYQKLAIPRVPYTVLGKETHAFKHRCTMVIAVPPGTSPADIDYALEDAGRVAKGSDLEAGAVMTWAVNQDNPRITVRGGVYAPQGDWANADGAAPLSVWSYKSMGEMATQRW